MEYLVRYSAKTLVSNISRSMQQKHGYGWLKIESDTVIYDTVLNHGGDKIHQGIGMDTIVDAESYSEAQRIARNHVSNIYNVLSFCLNTEVEKPEKKLCIEHAEGLEKYFFTQRFHLLGSKIPTGEVRDIDENFLKEVYIAVRELPTDENIKSNQNRMRRALHCYASALRQETIADQFTWFYIAFDTLEDFFVELYDSETDRIYKCQSCDENYICKNCGEPSKGYRRHVGKKQFLKEHGEFDVSFNKLRSTRGGLFHSGKIEGTEDYLQTMERIVRTAILEVLDISIEEYSEKIDLEKNGHLKQEEHVVFGFLTDYNPSEVSQFMEVPTMNLEEHDIDFKVVGDKLRRTPRTNISYNGNGVSLELLNVVKRFIGNSGSPDINSKQLEVNEND
jgi:hypothetical protein